MAIESVHNTSIGPVRVAITEYNHVFLSSDDLVVNGVPIRMGLHVYRDTGWDVHPGQPAYLSRRDVLHSKKEVSAVARRKIMAVMRVFIASFVQVYAADFQKAQQEKNSEERNKLLTERQQLQDQIVAIDQRLANL